MIGVAVVLAGCNGFPKTVPFAEAEHMPEKYPSYALGAATPIMTVGQQHWMVLPGAVVNPPSFALMQVSAESGLWASRWDAAPYSWLYQRATDGLTRVAAEIR
jgi:hypothetical protein